MNRNNENSGVRFLSGDVCWEEHGGSWYRQTGEHTYWVIRWDLDPDGPENEFGERLHGWAQLSEVVTDDQECNIEACRSYGWYYSIEHGCPLDDYGAPMGPLAMVEALHGYGHRAPLGDWYSDDPIRALRKAGSEAARLESNPDELAEALDRPVNRIGSTAREYRSGDLQSAILRGVAIGDKTAELMLRLGVGR